MGHRDAVARSRGNFPREETTTRTSLMPCTNWIRLGSKLEATGRETGRLESRQRRRVASRLPNRERRCCLPPGRRDNRVRLESLCYRVARDSSAQKMNYEGREGIWGVAGLLEKFRESLVY